MRTQSEQSAHRRTGIKAVARQTVGAAVVALEQLAGALGTALPALALLAGLALAAVLAPVGVGLLMAPALLRALDRKSVV